MLWMCILCLILFRAQLSLGEYECNKSGYQTFCKALQENDLYENLTATLNSEDNTELQMLQIEDGAISVINSRMFVNFPNIETLRLRNTSTQTVEQGAFADLLKLKNLYLTHNYLNEFDSNVFPVNNSLITLDLSHNLINNLDTFDVDHLPLLKILNISYNGLEYLPEKILNKVNEKNKFYLIIDNNPWDCLHPKWSQGLNELLTTAFCNNKNYDSSEIESKTEILANLESNDRSKTETESDNFFCVRNSMKNCLIWAFGAIWIGVILGNMCTLKRLLFTPPTRYEDKNIQCEFPWKEPFIRQEFGKADTQNKKMTSKDNIDKTG